MQKTLLTLALAAGGLLAPAAQAAELFPLASVRLKAGPFLDAQTTDLHYLLAFDPDKLLAPFRREAGLPQPQPSYGNWESTGLDGHMGGHYLSALALMVASTGDAQARERLDYMLVELKKCQDANGNGLPGGIAVGDAAQVAITVGVLAFLQFRQHVVEAFARLRVARRCHHQGQRGQVMPAHVAIEARRFPVAIAGLDLRQARFAAKWRQQFLRFEGQQIMQVRRLRIEERSRFQAYGREGKQFSRRE